MCGRGSSSLSCRTSLNALAFPRITEEATHKSSVMELSVTFLIKDIVVLSLATAQLKKNSEILQRDGVWTCQEEICLEKSHIKSTGHQTRVWPSSGQRQALLLTV